MANKAAVCAFALALLAGASGAAAQQQGETMVNKAMCYACHQMDEASIGPPWRAIAARHAVRKDVMVNVLASKIVKGGGGSWGLVPMVPNQRVSDAEAAQMAQWILQQAKK